MYQADSNSYEAAYERLSAYSRHAYPQELFIKRVSSIYEGIEVQSIGIQRTEASEPDVIRYHVNYETRAGRIEYDMDTEFSKRSL